MGVYVCWGSLRFVSFFWEREDCRRGVLGRRGLALSGRTDGVVFPSQKYIIMGLEREEGHRCEAGSNEWIAIPFSLYGKRFGCYMESWSSPV